MIKNWVMRTCYIANSSCFDRERIVVRVRSMHAQRQSPNQSPTNGHACMYLFRSAFLARPRRSAIINHLEWEGGHTRVESYLHPCLSGQSSVVLTDFNTAAVHCLIAPPRSAALRGATSRGACRIGGDVL